MSKTLMYRKNLHQAPRLLPFLLCPVSDACCGQGSSRDGPSLWGSKGRDSRAACPELPTAGQAWAAGPQPAAISVRRGAEDIIEPEKLSGTLCCSSQRTDAHFWTRAGNGSSAAVPSSAQMPPLMAVSSPGAQQLWLWGSSSLSGFAPAEAEGARGSLLGF